MNNRVAVMDLGTNTFHLLIAEYDVQNLFTEIRHEYVGVKLGEGGINEGTIKPDAYQRGVNTLINFGRLINEYEVIQIKAIGTSAMRSASNGPQFIAEVEERAGIRIETISGDREATYIFEGVKASDCISNQNSLIVDIGGGSVEFILGNDTGILYKQSFEIGAARLMALFHKTDPISNQEINLLYSHLDERLAPLFAALKGHSINDLIGSSGAFETFAEMVERSKGKAFDLKQSPVYHFEEQDLNLIIDNIVKANHDERAAMKGIIPVRVDMIVVASLLTQYLVSRLNIRHVVMSAYSLKEGVIAELFGVSKLQSAQTQ
jgi:exopolyphosphatase/guanosine-5'-triphosphate,3'-diphosphate pyrophosphatase